MIQIEFYFVTYRVTYYNFHPSIKLLDSTTHVESSTFFAEVLKFTLMTPKTFYVCHFFWGSTLFFYGELVIKM